MRTMAARTSEAKATVPHFYVQRRVEMDRALAYRAALNEANEVRVSVNDLVVRACGLALGDHPALRRHWTPDGFMPAPVASIGVAVALEDGALIVPVLRGVDETPLIGLASESAALVRRARERQLDRTEMGDATMTVSNLGMLGVTWFAAIINPPESAILAVGGVEPYLTLADGEVVQRSKMSLTLSVDHRVCAGYEAARFLATVCALLERPEALG